MFWLLLSLFLPDPGLSETYLNANQVQARRLMEKIAKQPYSQLASDPERNEWARARLAWVALERLAGNEKAALEIFAGCERFCEKYGPESEWVATKKWACQKQPKQKICRGK